MSLADKLKTDAGKVRQELADLATERDNYLAAADDARREARKVVYAKYHERRRKLNALLAVLEAEG
jgi:hypothetical protein